MRRLLTLTCGTLGLFGCSSARLEAPVIRIAVVGPDGGRTPSVAVGQTIQLVAYAYDASGASYSIGDTETWISRQPFVAIPSGARGVINGIAPGLATIVLGVAPGFSDSISVMVK